MKDIEIDRFCRAVQEFSGAVERIDSLFRSIFVTHPGKALEEPIRELMAAVRRLGTPATGTPAGEAGKDPQSTDRRVWTVKELATHLHMSSNAVYKMVERREVPHLRLGRRVVFDPAAIQGWLSDHRVPAD